MSEPLIVPTPHQTPRAKDRRAAAAWHTSLAPGCIVADLGPAGLPQVRWEKGEWLVRDAKGHPIASHRAGYSTATPAEKAAAWLAIDTAIHAREEDAMSPTHNPLPVGVRAVIDLPFVAGGDLTYSVVTVTEPGPIEGRVVITDQWGKVASTPVDLLRFADPGRPPEVGDTVVVTGDTTAIGHSRRPGWAGLVDQVSPHGVAVRSAILAASGAVGYLVDADDLVVVNRSADVRREARP